MLLPFFHLCDCEMLLPPSFQTDGDGHQGDASLVPAPQMVLLPLLKEQVYKIASCELGRTTCQNKPRQCRSNPRCCKSVQGSNWQNQKSWLFSAQNRSCEHIFGVLAAHSWTSSLGKPPKKTDFICEPTHPPHRFGTQSPLNFIDFGILPWIWRKFSTNICYSDL